MICSWGCAVKRLHPRLTSNAAARLDRFVIRSCKWAGGGRVIGVSHVLGRASWGGRRVGTGARPYKARAAVYETVHPRRGQSTSNARLGFVANQDGCWEGSAN